VRYRMRSPSE
nr:protamine mP2 [mice, Peptide Partial, 10 aa] [Mus sp.]